MPKSKGKPKHYEECMHCAFMHAFAAKHGGDLEAGFDELVHSAIKVAVLAYSKLDDDGRKEFFNEVEKQTSIVAALVESIGQGVTKH